jgi:uncharacterized BrkB/YihY/UPF0761 family membrane protein
MLFRVYLYFFDGYSKIYGSLGAVIVLLLWLYISDWRFCWAARSIQKSKMPPLN